MPYLTYSQLKQSAKMRIAPVMGRLMGAYAIYVGLSFVISEAAAVPALFTESIALQAFFYFLFSVLGAILTGIAEAGTQYLYLKLYCGRPVAVGDIFYGFTNQTNTCIGLSFMKSLFYTVPLMPSYIFSLQFTQEMEKMNLAILSSGMDLSTAAMPPEMIRSLTLMLFSFTPALVLITILSLVYSQAYYLMWDFPSCTAPELLRKSRLLMRGHKGRLFYIQICFIPLIMLGVITCGIGMLWIAPLIYAIETEFYLDLVTKRSVRR